MIRGRDRDSFNELLNDGYVITVRNDSLSEICPDEDLEIKLEDDHKEKDSAL